MKRVTIATFFVVLALALAACSQVSASKDQSLPSPLPVPAQYQKQADAMLTKYSAALVGLIQNHDQHSPCYDGPTTYDTNMLDWLVAYSADGRMLGCEAPNSGTSFQETL